MWKKYVYVYSGVLCHDGCVGSTGWLCRSVTILISVTAGFSGVDLSFSIYHSLYTEVSTYEQPACLDGYNQFFCSYVILNNIPSF